MGHKKQMKSRECGPERLERQLNGASESDFQEALSDLADIENEAIEEGFPIPAKAARKNAKQLLRQIHEITADGFSLYPTPDAEVAIDISGGRGCGLLLLCESSGEVFCIFNMHSVCRNARYSDASLLPDEFVRDALLQVQESRNAQA